MLSTIELEVGFLTGGVLVLREKVSDGRCSMVGAVMLEGFVNEHSLMDLSSLL